MGRPKEFKGFPSPYHIGTSSPRQEAPFIRLDSSGKILCRTMAFAGQASAQRPHPTHRSSSIHAVLSTRIAPVGQTVSQVPQPLHPSARTTGRKNGPALFRSIRSRRRVSARRRPSILRARFFKISSSRKRSMARLQRVSNPEGMETTEPAPSCKRPGPPAGSLPRGRHSDDPLREGPREPPGWCRR